MRNLKNYQTGRQRGAVLIVALVLLLVLTILGTAGIQDTTMEERMAGNFRDHSAAMQAAETALRAGEVELGSSTAFGNMSFSSSGANGQYDVALMTNSVDPKELSTAAVWVDVDATVLEKTSTLISADPRYYLEKLPEVKLPQSDLTVGFQDVTPSVPYFRITGSGSGISPNAEVILQSTYFR